MILHDCRMWPPGVTRKMCGVHLLLVHVLPSPSMKCSARPLAHAPVAQRDSPDAAQSPPRKRAASTTGRVPVPNIISAQYRCAVPQEPPPLASGLFWPINNYPMQAWLLSSVPEPLCNQTQRELRQKLANNQVFSLA